MATTKVFIEESKKVSAPQLSELFRQIAGGDLTGNHIQSLIRHENPFSTEGIAINWNRVYKRIGMEVSISPKLGANQSFWVVPVIKGVTLQDVVKAHGAINTFDDDPENKYWGLKVVSDDRNPEDGSYCAAFIKRFDGDPDLDGASAQTLANETVPCITLLERLLLELGYSDATGGVLDEWPMQTLCSGSRYANGDIPTVRFDINACRVCVYSLEANKGFEKYRGRRVIFTKRFL